MKRIHLVIIAFSLFSAGFTFGQCVSPSNVVTVTIQGKTYEVVKEMKNWADAAACAVERGGYLVRINDSAEMQAVYNAIVVTAAVPANYTAVMDGGGVAYVWIGATDKFTEGTWMWDGNNDGNGTLFWTGEGSAGANNGSAVIGAYINWGGTGSGQAKEPDDFGSGQDAAAIGLEAWPAGSGSLGIAGEWNDIALTNSLYFVIEYDSSGVGTNSRGAVPDMKIIHDVANNVIHVSTPGVEDVYTISLYNLLGSCILSKTYSGTHCQLNLPRAAGSIYLICLSAPGKTAARRKIFIF